MVREYWLMSKGDEQSKGGDLEDSAGDSETQDGLPHQLDSVDHEDIHTDRLLHVVL